MILYQSWFDPRLIHDDNAMARINTLQYLNGIHHYNDLWIPDILIKAAQSSSGQKNLNPSNIALHIYGNGSVVFSLRFGRACFSRQNIQKFAYLNSLNYFFLRFSRRQIQLTCGSEDEGQYPFDKPTCDFQVESGEYIDPGSKLVDPCP